MMWGPIVPEPAPTVPPDPTRYELTWGGPYPCLRYSAMGQHTNQCPGKMRPARRCFSYEGTLWRKFKCDRCGREATDTKDIRGIRSDLDTAR